MGKCLTIPGAAIPDLPAPLTLTIPLPPLHGLPDFCCTLPPLPIQIDVPFTIPSATINPALIVTFKKYRALMNKYLDARPLSCPKE